jgi:hypothetical protein
VHLFLQHFPARFRSAFSLTVSRSLALLPISQVFVHEQMGHQREALRLLVDEARDVTQTIELVERANNESLWSELIERITLHDEGSPVSPDFVGGMLQQVGGRLKEPHKLVEAIPSDMEVRAWAIDARLYASAVARGAAATTRML